jgi:TorA maturation chaperone TorD
VNDKTAELYLSFSGIFHRPHPLVAEHLEEFLALWQEEIPESRTQVMEIKDFCGAFPSIDKRLEALWEQYIPLFEAGDIEASPYASVYFSDKGLILGKEAEEVRRFYLACGYDMGAENQELPDHIAVELEFLALLARDRRIQEVNEFEEKHLRPFLGKILPLIMKSKRSVYSSVAEILEMWQFNSDRKGDPIG